MAIQLVIADDHLLVRAGVKNVLAPFDIEVIAETSSGTELLEILGRTVPNVVLLDVRFRPADGFEVLRSIKNRFPSLPVVMYSGYEHPAFMTQSHQLGAVGFLAKSASAQRYSEVLHAAANRKTTYSVEELRKINGSYASHRLNEQYDAPLTRREVEVLIYMAEGNTNKKIAERLSISSETVKEHVQHVLQKIGVSDRTQAVYWGITHGVVKL